eukprot:TRINITY_DN282_c0_g2_i1.p1 TRINITY_DN282_c0_g2~~TRINITY_DN282_c0_g2_i1.p1  ORF type:complete len:527 (-),score=78.93 TRINITY_DN282_c0_g2_i1:390-1817(-)
MQLTTNSRQYQLSCFQVNILTTKLSKPYAIKFKRFQRLVRSAKHQHLNNDEGLQQQQQQQQQSQNEGQDAPVKLDENSKRFGTFGPQQRFYAAVSLNRRVAQEKMKEMQQFAERWMNVGGFFGPFVLLAAAGFVSVKSLFGLFGIMGEYLKGEAEGKDGRMILAEVKEKERMKRLNEGKASQKEVELAAGNLKSREEFAASLQQSKISKEDEDLKKLDPTQQFVQSASAIDGIQIVSGNQRVPQLSTRQETPTESYGTFEPQHEIVDGRPVSPSTQEPPPDKKKQPPSEVSRPWWQDLDKITIIQFKLRDEDCPKPLYIESNFQSADDESEPEITIIAFECQEEALEFYNYMVPKWIADSEAGGEYPMWSQVDQIDIQYISPSNSEFLEEVFHLGYNLEVIPKGQLNLNPAMTYADFYERVLTICKIPGWEEVVMQQASWEDFGNDLDGAVKRHKKDMQYTGPGSVEGAQGYTIL